MKWHNYKRLAHLPESAPAELRGCYSEELRLALFEILANSMKELDEKKLLPEMCNIAVQWKNTAVHRREFFNLKQENGQTT